MDDLVIYGYGVEFSNITRDVKYWEAHYNHKVYKTEKEAVDAIRQMKLTGLYKNYEFRKFPLFYNRRLH